MKRTLLLLVAPAMLLGASPARADLASEVVLDYNPAPMQVVEAPRASYPFGVPNVSEFEPNPSAATGPVRIVRYPRPTYPFGIPNASEFEPIR